MLTSRRRFKKSRNKADHCFSLNCCEMAAVTQQWFLESAGKLWKVSLFCAASVWCFLRGKDWLNLLATSCPLHCVHGKWNGQAGLTQVFRRDMFGTQYCDGIWALFFCFRCKDDGFTSAQSDLFSGLSSMDGSKWSSNADVFSVIGQISTD